MDLPNLPAAALRGWALSCVLIGCSVAVEPGSRGSVLEPMPPMAIPVEPVAPGTTSGCIREGVWCKLHAAMTGVPPEHVARMRGFLQRCVEQRYFAGVTSCVVQRGELLERDAFGFRDLEAGLPMTTDTICRIASSTKPIIAAAMLMLHEEGRWQLDDELAKHIPQLAHVKVRQKDGSLVDPIQPMRMRHLMSHAIGFSLWRNTGARTEGAAESGARTPVLSRMRGGLQALIDRLAELPLAFHPGKRFLYGMCCDVQGYVIEQLSGQTLDRFLAERLFAPLGMRDTGFWVEREKCDRVASLYRYEQGALTRSAKPDPERISRKPTFLSGSGGLWSTPDDYQRFCQMLLAEGDSPGGRVLRSESVRSLRQDLLEPQVYVQVIPGYRIPGARFGMNVQVITEPVGDNAMYGKDTYSWGGAFGTYFWVDPTHELFVSGMVQIVNGGSQHLGASVEYPDLKQGSAQLLYRGRLEERATVRRTG
jgi:CubicO group peptidase (beta-lactamase class C family)